VETEPPEDLVDLTTRKRWHSILYKDSQIGGGKDKSLSSCAENNNDKHKNTTSLNTVWRGASLYIVDNCYTEGRKQAR